MNNIPLYVHSMFYLSIPLLNNTWFFSHCLGIVDNASMNTGVQYLLKSLLKNFGVLYQRWNCRVMGYPMFSFLRNYHAIFLRGCTILYSHHQCTRVPVVLHPHQHLLLSLKKKKKIAILVGVKWYLLVLICISLMANDVDPILICLLVICVSSLEEYLFKSPIHR